MWNTRLVCEAMVPLRASRHGNLQPYLAASSVYDLVLPASSVGPCWVQDTFKAWELPKRAPPAEVQLRQSVPFDATTSYAETFKPYELQPRHVIQRPQYAGEDFQHSRVAVYRREYFNTLVILVCTWVLSSHLIARCTSWAIAVSVWMFAASTLVFSACACST